MSAETYDLVLSLIGSAMVGGILFLIGLCWGWMMWRGTKKKHQKNLWEGETERFQA